MSSRRNLVAVFPSHLRTGLASTHFVNFSTATRRWVKPEGAFLKGPTMSMPHTANSQVMGIVLSAELGTCVWLAYFWHPTHRWTMSTTCNIPKILNLDHQTLIIKIRDNKNFSKIK